MIKPIACILLGVAAAWITLFLCGCSTISPDLPQAHEIQYLDGFRDAGVKGHVRNLRTGEDMLLISAAKVAEYNALIPRFGDQFTPPLQVGQGIIAYHGRYAIRNDEAVDFIVMKALAK